MRVLITGSRNVSISQEAFDLLLLRNIYSEDHIIHGGASGIDTMCQNTVDKCENLSSDIYRPIKSIPIYYLHRNAEMVGMCDRVIAFWDGKSRGTKFTIDYARARGKPVRIIEV